MSVREMFVKNVGVFRNSTGNINIHPDEEVILKSRFSIKAKQYLIIPVGIKYRRTSNFAFKYINKD
jgi:hypothetical protein